MRERGSERGNKKKKVEGGQGGRMGREDGEVASVWKKSS